MIRLREITNGKQGAGNGIVASASKKLGGVLVSTDGSNIATLTVRKTNGAGELIIDNFTTKFSIFIGAPFEGADVFYWELVGAGAGVQLFEWEEYYWPAP